MNINSLINANEAVSCVPDNSIRRDGIVYVIYKMDDTKTFYIGSTFKTLRDRIMYHRIASRNGSNMKLYNCVNQFGWEMFNSQVLEQVKFVTRGELLKREGDYQLFYKPILNTNIAGNCLDEYGNLLTKKEYRENNAEHIKERKHEYYENNKDEILRKCKE